MKAKLYEKCMKKKRSPRNENIYKACKSLFESINKPKKIITQDVLKNIKTI